MLQDLLRAFGQLTDPAVRRCIWQSIGLAVLAFLLLLAAAEAALALAGSTGHAWLDWLLRLMAAGGVGISAWLLFPATVALGLGLFADRVADAVERRWYPGLPPALPQPLSASLAASLRLGLVAIALNLLALPFYLFLPLVNIVLFLSINGYIFGREHAELVLARRLPPAAVRELWRRRRGFGWRTGAATAVLLLVPFVNILAPVIGIALSTHRFYRLPELRAVIGEAGRR